VEALLPSSAPAKGKGRAGGEGAWPGTRAAALPPSRPRDHRRRHSRTPPPTVLLRGRAPGEEIKEGEGRVHGEREPGRKTSSAMGIG
jgi:hypothetical protein